MRKIKNVHPSEYRPIADLVTYSPMPTRRLPDLDPFLFVNHHGHQVYPPGNQGMPFGPHPHRGMETVTFIFDGDIMHEDSGGHKETIGPKGIQYMTAGKGVIHSEVSSPAFMENGGDLEILQLWLNLPSRLKKTEPKYSGKQADEMTEVPLDQGSSLQLIFGEWEGSQGSFTPSTPMWMGTLYLNAGTSFSKTIDGSEEVLCYIVRGSVKVNGMDVQLRELVQFEREAGELVLDATEDAAVILGHAKPFDEPIVAQGPFVMNTQEEIFEAYRDYQEGKFG